MSGSRFVAGFLFCLMQYQSAGHAQDAALAKELTNPVSSLISVPLQSNFDRGIGPAGNGTQFYLNVQPVIPIPLSADWNVVSRTILPVVSQNEIFPGSGNQFGLSDTLQSLFLTPAQTGSAGIIWGLGPVFLLPTATDKLLGRGQWGAGPTGVVLKQSGPWTFGLLANHVWSFAGDTSRSGVSSTFAQPFLSYTTDDAWTFTLNSETSYDWIGRGWSVPANFMVSKVLDLGGQPISIGAGARYWLTSPDNGPTGFGARLILTFLFPTGR